MEIVHQRVCAWCTPPKVLSQGALPPTHGMCDDCYREMMERIREQSAKNPLASTNKDR